MVKDTFSTTDWVAASTSSQVSRSLAGQDLSEVWRASWAAHGGCMVLWEELWESPEDVDYSHKKGLKEEISPRLEDQPDIVQDLSKKIIFNFGIQQLNTLFNFYIGLVW